MTNNQVLDQQTYYYNKYLKIKDNPRYTKVWDFFRKNTRKGKLLYIGCTNGDFSEKLIKWGYDCYGLEYLDEAVDQSTGKGIKVTKGSFLDKFPFIDQQFDFIFAGEVIEHTTDDDFFLSECYRVLKPKGILVVTTPNLVSLGNRFLMLLGKLPRFSYSEFHYRVYNKALLGEKIEKSGFEILKWSSSYVLISKFFNKFLGFFGEMIGTFIPVWGENFIVISSKKTD